MRMKVFVTKKELFSYVCFFLSFPTLVNGFQSLITTIYFGWDHVILLTIKEIFIGFFLFIIGYWFLISSQEFKKYKQPVKNEITVTEEKIFAQLK
ncbi:MAG: hypothetical protein KAT35_02940, partial [Candidatus Aenigmarchaeota archaeon]|nr:hypothetical protein [Candidatus Aenigmarchaeota archaeon]